MMFVPEKMEFLNLHVSREDGWSFMEELGRLNISHVIDLN